jgi:hypothetical protein
MRLPSCLYFIQHLKMLALFTHSAMHNYNSVKQNLMVKHKNGKNMYIYIYSNHSYGQIMFHRSYQQLTVK